MEKTMKKLLSIILSMAILVSLGVAALAAEFTDTSDSWAKEVIDKWAEDYGIVNGFEDGSFRPDDYITRGQFAKILDSVMKYQVTATDVFTDLDTSDWYYEHVLKLNAAGVINGTSSTTIAGDSFVTREQAFTMLQRMFSIAPDEAALSAFSDAALVSSWARGPVGGMVKAGYVQGSDGKLSPERNLTRAQAVQVLDNIIGDIVNEGGTHSPEAGGTVIVNAPDVTLENTTIETLYIAPGVGSGNVTLNNVKVIGKMTVMGGGENSIIITGGSSVGTVTVYKDETGAVRIKVEGGAEVEFVYVDDGSDEVIITGEVGNVVVGEGTTVSAVDATIGAITVSGNNASLKVSENTVVTTVAVTGGGAALEVSGKVTEVTVTGNNAKVATTTTAVIETVKVEASNTSVEGTGKVTNVTVEAGADNQITTPGTEIANNSDAPVSTGDGGTVGSGETGKAPETPVTPTPPSGGDSGPDAATVARQALDNALLSKVGPYQGGGATVSIGTGSINNGSATGTISLTISGIADQNASVSTISGTGIFTELANFMGSGVGGCVVTKIKVDTVEKTVEQVISELSSKKFNELPSSYSIELTFNYSGSSYTKTYTVNIAVSA